MKDVPIYCQGEQTVARFERGIWRCARCGKHVRVLDPDPKSDPVPVKGAA